MIKIRLRLKNLKLPYDVSSVQSIVDHCQDVLKIQQDVRITFKNKRDVYDSKVAVTFRNDTSDCISIHCYVHKHSIERSMQMVICHEMVHAWQLDNNLSTCEEQADELGLSMCRTYLVTNDGSLDSSTVTCSLKVAREFIN